MKKGMILGLLVVIFSISGCNQAEKKEIARLTQENGALKTEAQVKDSSINKILSSLHEIENNLAVIREKESIINVKTSESQEMAPDVKERINEDIKSIYELMLKNKKQIAWLKKQLRDSNLKISEFDKMVEQLNAQIVEKDSQIAGLNDQLTKLNFDIAAITASMDTLKTEKTSLLSTISNQTSTINTAYYVTGTKKELLTGNIIKKEGGIIGINSVPKIQQDVDETKFQKIDIRNFEEINVNSKKIKLVTTHPASSYKLATNAKGEVEKIQITNPEKFWSKSKYLVVMIN